MTRWMIAIIVIGLSAADCRADDIDKLAQSMDVSDTESMAVAGVLGKTVDQLKDPRSLQIVDAHTKRSENLLIGCLEFRSKNSFGGYVPGRAAWNLRVAKGKPTLAFSVDNASQWNRSCAGKGFKGQKALATTLFEKIRAGI